MTRRACIIGMMLLLTLCHHVNNVQAKFPAQLPKSHHEKEILRNRYREPNTKAFFYDKNKVVTRIGEHTHKDPETAEKLKCMLKCPPSTNFTQPPYMMAITSVVMVFCHEDVDFLFTLDCDHAKVFLYSRCGRHVEVPSHLKACTEIRTTPPTELGTQPEVVFLEHIIEHYDNPTKLTMFVHGTVDISFRTYLAAAIERMEVFPVGFYSMGHHIKAAAIRAMDFKRYDIDFVVPLFKGVFCAEPPKRWRVGLQAAFTVGRGRIQAWPKCKYEGILQHIQDFYAKPVNPRVAGEMVPYFCMERLWGALFQCHPSASLQSGNFVCQEQETRTVTDKLIGMQQVHAYGTGPA
eukprot:jgi/Mesvir1/14407/Mv09794-RA.1